MTSSTSAPPAHETFLHAAMLAGLGPHAVSWAASVQVALAAGARHGRSCLSGGAPLQFTLDAPHVAGIRFGVLLPVAHAARAKAISALLPTDDAATLIAAAHALPPMTGDPRERVGDWLFVAVSPDGVATRSSLFAEVPSALQPLLESLGHTGHHGLPGLRELAQQASPYAVRLESQGGILVRRHVQWTLHRRRDPADTLRLLHPGLWDVAEPHLAAILGRRITMASRRWMVATVMDDTSPSALRLVSPGWALTPDGPRKRQALEHAWVARGGQLDHLQALWSLFRHTAGDRPAWRVGRAVGVRLSDEATRMRVLLVPRAP